MDKTRITPKTGATYLAFGQKDSPFKIIEELNEGRGEYMVKNLATGWEVCVYGLQCFSDGSMEFESSRNGRFC